MSGNNLTRRAFMAGTSTGVIGATLSSSVSCRSIPPGSRRCKSISTKAFAREIERVLPPEETYAYHKRLSENPVHVKGRRAPEAALLNTEFALPDQGWTMFWQPNASEVLKTAVHDFQDYLKTSMGVHVGLETPPALPGVPNRSIVAGTRAQLPGYGATLKGPKDYEISASPKGVTVCGYDERGVMYGLYNLEARMNLREAPFLPRNLKTVRHSLYSVLDGVDGVARSSALAPVPRRV